MRLILRNRSPQAWLLDASIYIFRAWFSMPDRWYCPEGRSINALYGYAGFLCDRLSQAGDAQWFAAAFDESLGTGFRHALYPGYKASRELPDEALAFQLAACRQLTELSGIACYSGPRYEADDYLASLATLAKTSSFAVTVMTRDKDLGQLLQDNQDRWWDVAADLQLDKAGFEQRFGVRPDQFADYLALVGDAVDDIPGVPGVGPKTAAALLVAFDDIDGIWRDLAQVATLPIRGAAGLADKLAAHTQQVKLARQLTGLEHAIADLKVPEVFTLDPDNLTAVVDYLESLGIGGALMRRWQGLQRAEQCA